MIMKWTSVVRTPEHNSSNMYNTLLAWVHPQTVNQNQNEGEGDQETEKDTDQTIECEEGRGSVYILRMFSKRNYCY